MNFLQPILDNPMSIFLSLLLLVVLVFLWLSVNNFKYAYGSKNWPLITATVTKTEIENVNHNSSVTRYQPQITYSYSVNNIDYSYNFYSYNETPTFSTEEEAHDFLKSYALGNKINVSYCPSSPNYSVIIPGMSLNIIIWLIVSSIASIGLSIYLCLLFKRIYS